MEMIKFLDKEEIEKRNIDKFYKDAILEPIYSPPSVLSGSYNLVSNPCTLTLKQLREHASRLL